MTSSIRSNFQDHPFHLVSPYPWSLLISVWILVIFMGVLETFSPISISDSYLSFADRYLESYNSLSEISIHVCPIILNLVYYLLIILLLILSHSIDEDYDCDFLLELSTISNILLEWGREVRKLLVYIKKKAYNNYNILLSFWAILPLLYSLLSIFNIVDYNLYIIILSPTQIIWLVLTHYYYSDYFYLNDFQKEVNGTKVTIKGLKTININFIVFFIVVFIVILLLFIFIGIPLYFNGHLLSTIHNISIIRSTIIPIVICMVILYMLINIRNRYDGIVFINSLSTLLGFSIAFNTLSGIHGFFLYCQPKDLTILKTNLKALSRYYPFHNQSWSNRGKLFFSIFIKPLNYSSSACWFFKIVGFDLIKHQNIINNNRHFYFLYNIVCNKLYRSALLKQSAFLPISFNIKVLYPSSYFFDFINRLPTNEKSNLIIELWPLAAKGVLKVSVDWTIKYNSFSKMLEKYPRGFHIINSGDNKCLYEIDLFKCDDLPATSEKPLIRSYKLSNNNIFALIPSKLGICGGSQVVKFYPKHFHPITKLLTDQTNIVNKLILIQIGKVNTSVLFDFDFTNKVHSNLIEAIELNDKTEGGSDCDSETTLVECKTSWNDLFNSIEKESGVASVKSKALDPQCNFSKEYLADSRVIPVFVSSVIYANLYNLNRELEGIGWGSYDISKRGGQDGDDGDGNDSNKKDDLNYNDAKQELFLLLLSILRELRLVLYNLDARLERIFFLQNSINAQVGVEEIISEINDFIRIYNDLIRNAVQVRNRLNREYYEDNEGFLLNDIYLDEINNQLLIPNNLRQFHQNINLRSNQLVELIREIDLYYFNPELPEIEDPDSGYGR